MIIDTVMNIYHRHLSVIEIELERKMSLNLYGIRHRFVFYLNQSCSKL